MCLKVSENYLCGHEVQKVSISCCNPTHACEVKHSPHDTLSTADHPDECCPSCILLADPTIGFNLASRIRYRHARRKFLAEADEKLKVAVDPWKYANTHTQRQDLSVCWLLSSRTPVAAFKTSSLNALRWPRRCITPCVYTTGSILQCIMLRRLSCCN